jgi:hypothetical protein
MVDKKTNEDLINNPFNIKLTNSEDYTDLITSYMNEGLVLEAINVSKVLEELILDSKIKFKQNKESKSEYELYETHPVILSIQEDEELIFKCLDNYKKMNKRDPDRSSNGIDSWFNYEDKLSSMTICGRVTLNVKMLNLIAMFKEIDLLQEQVDQFEFINLMEKITFTKWTAHCGIKMPMTFSNRDLVLIGVGLFDKKEQLFIIAFKSLEQNKGKTVPQPDSKHCRIDMNFGFYIAKYLDENHSELFTCFNVDPKVSVPWFLINTFTKDVGYYMTSDFRKIAEKVGLEKIYEERINKFKEDYDKIKKAINIS